MKKLLIAGIAVGVLANVGDAAAQAAPAPAAATPKCRLQRAADWKVRDVAGLPLVEVEVNGQKVEMLVDTGAPYTLVTNSFAMQQRLSRGPATEVAAGNVEAAIIDEAKIGAFERKSWRVHVATRDLGRDVTLVLGQDFLQDTAVEFDLPTKELRLYVPANCEDAFIGYWKADNLRHVSLEAGTKASVRVEVNGQPLDAIIDSGALTSVLARTRAERIGVTEKSPGATAGGCATGFAKEPVETTIGQFEGFSFGPQLVRNPRLAIANLAAPPPSGRGPRSFGAVPEMVLGLDFLQSHRVLIWPAQRRVYFSYSGGTVFPAKPTPPCRTGSR